MTYFYAGKFCFINFPTMPVYFFRPRPTLPTVYPYHMGCDVNLVILILGNILYILGNIYEAYEILKI